MTRLSQAISEGDGISVIPLLEGDVPRLAAIAESAGAEAVAVWRADDVTKVREASSLPLLVRVDTTVAGEADAAVLPYGAWGDSGEALEELSAEVRRAGLECVVEVVDEDALADVLDRVDPEVILISTPETDAGETGLERALDLLPDVPAGKLVIVDSHVAVAPEQVAALERAGVDAVLVRAREDEFERIVSALTGRSE